MIVKLKDFHIPKKIVVDEATLTDTYGKFVAEPFERGFGTTIGNSLRRVLLSSIGGAAVTSVKIEGVLHEFSTIPGVKEDVADIILNIKNLRFKLYTDKTKTVYIQKKGPGIVKGSDIIHDADVEVLTPDLVIATLGNDAKLDIEMTVKVGRGYVPAEQNKEEGLPIGIIPVDSLFSPIQRVNFRVEKTRVGRRTDYDRLIMEVWTDGSIRPEEAISYAAKILKEHLDIFILNEEVDTGSVTQDTNVEQENNPEKDNNEDKIRELLSKSVEELELSVRSANCLKNAKIMTIGDLVQKSESEMLETKNFGKKSLNEIKAILEGMGLSFGMKVDHLYGDTENK